MEGFFEADPIVTRIHFANLVGGEVIDVHNDRKNHGLVAVFGGTTMYRFDSGKEIVIGDGDILYLPHHSNYTNTTLKRGECYCINFSITEDVYNEPAVFSPKNMSVFENLFKIADRYWMAKLEGYEIKCRSILYDFLYHLKGEMALEYSDSGKFELIAPAVDYIHANYTTEAISIGGLAKMCGISHEYLRRLFRLRYNTTPVAYINSMKIARAKELISSGLYSVTEAALASGYSDMSHFSREFKKATGMPPSLYGK